MTVNGDGRANDCAQKQRYGRRRERLTPFFHVDRGKSRFVTDIVWRRENNEGFFHVDRTMARHIHQMPGQAGHDESGD